jgi:hypothetical protein
MRDLIPIRHRQPCPQCEKNTMRISLLNATAGRTGFVGESCIECGYIRTYSVTVKRPAWHWIIGIVGLFIIICILFLLMK